MGGKLGNFWTESTDGTGPAAIDSFTPILTKKNVLRLGSRWYATDQSILPQLPEEVSQDQALIEGAAQKIMINAYERNPIARKRCLAHYGHSCIVCSFNFEERYGVLGRDYIHVHHLVPIGSLKKEYIVDPIKDLVPVCPNCHAMIHRNGPAATLGIAELRNLLLGPIPESPKGPR
ncbi:HNH endonuclease [Candidatus Methylomirabilis sp.]|uniref:HNH endonuclease n=1 Tax=Candidatus Methylomirabilis sp. TaxID=2032687 RepID=UPI003C77E247